MSRAQPAERQPRDQASAGHLVDDQTPRNQQQPGQRLTRRPVTRLPGRIGPVERLARYVLGILGSTQHHQRVAVDISIALPVERLERLVHGLHGAGIANSLEYLFSLSLDAHQLHHTGIDEAAERSVPRRSGGFQALGAAPLRSRASREPMRGSGPRRAMSPSADRKSVV